MYEFRNVMGHIEVYRYGSFLFSADSRAEAEQEIRKQEERNVPWTVMVV